MRPSRPQASHRPHPMSRSRGVEAPHMPKRSGCSSAAAQHSVTTAQPAHTAFARSLPGGVSSKKSTSGCSRQVAAACHAVSLGDEAEQVGHTRGAETAGGTDAPAGHADHHRRHRNGNGSRCWRDSLAAGLYCPYLTVGAPARPGLLTRRGQAVPRTGRRLGERRRSVAQSCKNPPAGA